MTLMDEGKTSDLKTSEALEMASRWEMSQRPFAAKVGGVGGGGTLAGAAGNSNSAAEQVKIIIKYALPYSSRGSHSLGKFIFS